MQPCQEQGSLLTSQFVVHVRSIHSSCISVLMVNNLTDSPRAQSLATGLGRCLRTVEP